MRWRTPTAPSVRDVLLSGNLRRRQTVAASNTLRQRTLRHLIIDKLRPENRWKGEGDDAIRSTRGTHEVHAPTVRR
jgi:hypothetical protein